MTICKETKFVCTNGCLGKDGNPVCFGTKQNLERHMKTKKCIVRKSVPMTYHCKYCDWTAPDKTAYEKHCGTEMHSDLKWAYILYENNKHKIKSNKPNVSTIDQSWIDDWELENDSVRKKYLEKAYHEDLIELTHSLNLASETYMEYNDYEDLRDELYRLRAKYKHFVIDTDNLENLQCSFKWCNLPKDW